MLLLNCADYIIGDNSIDSEKINQGFVLLLLAVSRPFGQSETITVS